MSKAHQKKKPNKSYTGKPFDVISVGDATMDMFLQMDSKASRLCKKDTKNCFLMLSYADKIEADGQEFATGGNSANLAIGSSRLGLRSAFYTVIGDDRIGGIIEDAIADEGVATDYITHQKHGKTNFHVVLNHEAERTIIIYHNPRKYTFPKLKKSEWIYYSSMAEGFERVQADLVKHVKKHKIKLGFNPGTLQLKAGYKVLKPAIEVCELFIVNVQEAERLLGAKHNGADIKRLLHALHEIGPKNVVITDGPHGSYAYDGQSYWKMGIYDVPVVERTGAGDSTSTGIVAAMVYGQPIQEALRWGVFNSASVIQEVGPQKGLLTKAKMNKFLKENKSVVAKEF